MDKNTEVKIKMEAKKNLSIYHLVRFPAGYNTAAPNTVYPTILALHGHGSNERDLIGLADALPQNILWISGRGPERIAPDGFDWYPVTQFGQPDPILLGAALDGIDNFITELLATYPIDRNNLFLLGFSQGSMIAMTYLLRYPKRIKGVIAQSGYIPLGNDLPVHKEIVKGKPVIMTHGMEDSRLPLEWSQRTRDFLLHCGVDVTYRNFHMDHTITDESLAAIHIWLEKELSD